MGLLAELKRRHVFRMAGVYLVGAWLITQVVGTILPMFDAPAWVPRAIVLLLAIGFIPALIISWIFKLTPEGLKRDANAKPQQALTTAYTERKDRRAPAPAAQLASLPISEKSIAVLPFHNLAHDHEVDPFVNGMHDDLLTQLAKIRSLKVISNTSVQEYRDTKKNLRQIAAELGVATILEGGVQLSSKRVRINAQLIDARADKHLWAETYDRELNAESLFDMQSDIAHSIATALRAQLLPEEAAFIERRLTTDLTAWMAYRTALHLVNRADVGDFDAATAQIDFALGRDPKFAAAWALRSRNAIARYWFNDPSAANLQASRAALECGLAIDPDSPELRLAEGYFYYWGHRDYDRALIATDAAQKIIPNDADLHRLRGFILRRKGDWKESILAQQAALEYDPRNAFGHTELALTFLKLREFTQAQAHIKAGLELDPLWGFARLSKAIVLIERDQSLNEAIQQMNIPDPGNTLPALWRWWLYVARGDYKQALAHANFGAYVGDRNALWPPALMRGLTYRFAGRKPQSMLELASAENELNALLLTTPGFEPAIAALCLCHAASGNRDEAEKLCAQLLENPVRDAMQLDETRYLVAMSLAMVGAHDKALDVISILLSNPHYNGVAHLELDPAFISMRSEPRFIEMMDKFRTGSQQ